MDKHELIEKYELELKDVQLKFGSSFKTKVFEEVLEDLKQLDDPEPIKLRDVIARIKQLDIGTRKVWLDEFLNELGGDYGTLKYKDGYEQGKLEGSMVPYEEPQKVTVPQFVADWYEGNKNNLDYNILNYVCGWEDQEEDGFKNWFNHSNKAFQTLVNMHQFGYTVEKEKRYFVRLKHAGISNSLLKRTPKGEWWFGINFDDDESQAHTRKELEEAGFEEVFNSPLFEVKEVEE